MATLPRVYRYRLRLSADQERHFLAYAGARRFVYNWALARRKAHFAALRWGSSLPAPVPSRCGAAVPIKGDLCRT